MPSLTTIGDEPLEARIVAWVLGDASAFEVAELERLCAERPELLVFRRRMRALHGLLTESEATQPDTSWKLPPEKRKVLDELFGTPARLTNKPTPARKRRSTWKWTLSALAACLIALLVIGAMFSMKGIGHSGRFITAMGKADEKKEASGRMVRYSPAYEPQAASAGKNTHRSLEESESLALYDLAGVKDAAAEGKDSGGLMEREFETLGARGTAAPSRPAKPSAPLSSLDTKIAARVKGESILAPEPAAAAAPPPASQSTGIGGGGGGLATGGGRTAPNPTEPPPPTMPAATPGAIASTRSAPSDLSTGSIQTGETVRPNLNKSGTGSLSLGLETANLKPAEPSAATPVSGRDIASTTYNLTTTPPAGPTGSIVRGNAVTTQPALPDPVAIVPATPNLPLMGKLFSHEAGQNQPADAGATATNGALHLDMVDALTDRQPAKEDLEVSYGFSTNRSDADRFPPTPPPALTNRFNWHLQDGGTKANLTCDSTIVAGRAILTDSPAGGLKTDLSKSLAERETVRRQESTTEADRLLVEGRDDYQNVRFREGQAKFKSAGEKLPDAPLTEDRKKGIAALDATATTALAKEEDARKSLESLGDDLKPVDGSVALGSTIPSLETAAKKHSDPAPVPSLSGKVNAEQKTTSDLGLQTADGAYQLGKYDQAKQEYEKVLRAEPNNIAARQGLETIAKNKSQYYRAAYDQTRAELLTDVDKEWDESMPADPESLEKAVANQEEKVKEMVIARKLDAIKDKIPRQYYDHDEPQTTLEAESAKLSALKARLASVTPKPAPPVPADELSAEAEPYSTFSLSVSDASFKTAHAALMQNNIPDPAGIRVEQFYNAMDYGDPYPAAGEPVAAAIEQAAHPVIPGRNLVRVALRTAAAGRAASQPLCLTLLIDQSGSMARDDRRQALTRALSELATLLTPADRVTVIGFSLAPRMLADRLPGDQAAKLAGLVNMDANEGGTNLERALMLGKDVAEARRIEGAQNRIVLFTDGAANLGNADPAKLAETIRQVRQRGLAFDVAGLGTSELNDRLLAELARHGNGRFHVVDAVADDPDSFAKQLAGAFRPAAENVKVQVRFNPRRVGGYKLLGFEEHRLKREDFHNDAVDAAEMAAAEAGIALYQIEPLPNGSGDIGEMSVRFRDTATGNMVERSWSIPYDPNTPAFDRANPPLQLAGLAMLAAEKLRGGPLGAATDFTTLTPSRTTIRQFYPQQRRAADLLDMIDRIR